jgi:N-acetylglutamate synthase-like GNAT family acetyltransferase
MSTAGYQVRRATVDDLPDLVALWNSMRLPADQLERRLTEFQVVEGEDGALLGAVGIDIIERHGRIHSEAFNDFAHADIWRDKLWERLQSVATNHGLARLWTAEVAPFWKRNGFHPADAVELKRLPPAWNATPADWLTLRLRDEDALRASLDMDFERLREQERQESRRLLSKAKTINYIALSIVFVVVVVALYFCINMLRFMPFFRHR